MRRRSFLKLAAGAGLAPFITPLLTGEASAQGRVARRLIVFYFPDGVAGPSQDGEASLWHAQGREFDFRLGEQLAPLAGYREQAVFFNGLTMGGTDSGSHPGGAVKLLTAVDHGNGVSVDQHLARTVGANDPHRLLYLGVQANANNASGDKHISYPAPGRTTPPEDDPRRAFERLFPGEQVVGQPSPQPRGPDRRQSVLDGVKADLDRMRGQVSGAERARLEFHLESLREVERRVQGAAPMMPDATCDDPRIGALGGELYAPEVFPQVLDLQMDVMVQAMACGLTRVGVMQCGHHTSELIMSRFPGTPFHDPGFDMRSHQASHYGPRHDRGRREFSDYLAQRVWWVSQYAELLRRLAERPEGDGTMLDNSLVLLCTEVCDGNTHLHDNMPFVLAGGGAGTIRTGRLHDAPNTGHGELLAALCHAMGDPVERFGQHGNGPLSGLLS
ncbi:MAG: DUF1552 domain-containing protein [Bradymonadia bacterium]